MNVDLRSLAGHIAGLAWVAVRSFAGTLALLIVVGAALAAISYGLLREAPWQYRSGAAGLALAESAVAGVMLGMSRATANVLAYALGKLRLGSNLVALIFDRLVAAAGADPRGGQVVSAVARLPLAQTDVLLSSTVRELTGEVEANGWLRNKIQARLLEAVGKYTLARFREEGAQHGGVNLLAVRSELERAIDDSLVKNVQQSKRWPAVLAAIGLPLLVALQTWGIQVLWASQR